MQPLIVAQQVTQGVSDFLRTAFPSTTPGFVGLLDRYLAQRENLFKGPYLTVPLPFRAGTAQRKPYSWLDDSFIPHAHQSKAFARLDGSDAQSTLIATGTGSGKTECFTYPILEHCRQARAAGRTGIKAIILYPMNALASDQANRLAKLLVRNPALQGIRAGLYVGDVPAEESDVVRHVEGDTYTLITDRNALRKQPPDILLTNYKMLDFQLIRASDSGLWAQQQPDTLRYLVVDELHTFDGAQGTDLACLIRRLKGRLNTAPGQLVCVGTSATLGDGVDGLLDFAGDVFGEKLDAASVIAEDRVSVGDYLADATVESMLNPQAGDAQRLDPANYDDLHAFLAAQVALWFGEACTPSQLDDVEWRCDLGNRLKSHFAFQNLLRDLERLGPKSVLVDDLLTLLRRRLARGPDALADERFALLWLSSLLSLVAHARLPGKPGFFLQVKVEIWLRELRRMVARVDVEPVLRPHDDLGKADKGDVYLPVIHCRDCHATGWGATLPRTSPNQLQQDLRSFYSAFFAEDVVTRFLFPATDGADRRSFERKPLCPKCGTLHQSGQNGCSHCGHDTLVMIDITANLREATRNGARFMRSSHDCPYCAGRKTLTIVGSQAASLAAVMVGQLFSSRYNQDKKLIAFSDSVQDAAHRAGFLAARTWRLNLRPALAQTIEAANEAKQPLTLADLPAAFEQRWLSALGEGHYVANFLPPQLHWMRDVETLMSDGALPDNSQVPRQLAQVLPWVINAEFGQDAHVGRTLVATGTACVTPVSGSLKRAQSWLHEQLREHVDALRGVAATDVLVFLQGLVGEMQRMGAWRDPGLAFYARIGCVAEAYRRNVSQQKMLQGPRPARFLTIPPYQRCISIERDDAQLFRDWAFKALPPLHGLALGAEAVVQQIYHLALEALAAGGLAGYEQAQDRNEIRVWGLEPAAFLVEMGGCKWRCGQCHNETWSGASADLAGQPCRRKGCTGQLQTDTHWGEFYRKLYLTGEIQRVVAHEHTGLLPRDTRERIEADFKSGSNRPGSINVLSATPTLEMGIDIGDLSSALMCSVPPQQANYVQRGGRAGRSTGNALVMTMAASRPHDLYFWDDPREMLTGSVRAPGVFLNASAVLERQLTAFTLDCWVRVSGRAAVIPEEVRQVFTAITNQTLSKFPYPWLSYVEMRRGELLDRFIGLFNQVDRNPLSTETQAWLSKFIHGSATDPGSLGWKIVNRLSGIAKDVAELKRQRERTGREVEKLEALAVRGEEDELELGRLIQERTALSRLIGSIEGKATLNVLTDEGLLPNYAFPEQGVLLRSIIIRENRPGSDPAQPETFEYELPSASAITELAPNNTFYAEGRRVVVNQVDVSKIKPDPWRFCRQCSYAELLSSGDQHINCPRCGDAMWRDAGRVRDMVKLTTVFARTLDRDSRIADDSDERQRGFYVRQALVDSPPDCVRSAYVIDKPEFPFGFEFLDRVSFREVNFGEQVPDATPMTIAGTELNRPGFAICAECGTIQRRRKAEDAFKNHAPYCSRRRSAEAVTQQCVFLYREFVSEGIRLYLPEGGAGESESRLLSFVAAVELGLTRRFRGAVDHLRIALDIRMAAGQDTPRCYLVIYDSVPGGTGYLKELMRAPEPLLEVLVTALQALNECACNQDPEADGCYRCVYAYRNSFDRQSISRNTAQQLLGEIVQHKASLKPIDNLAGVHPSNSLFESALEQRFVEALRRDHGGKRYTLTEVLFKGKPSYQLQAGARRWRLELQVSLNESNGVVVPCKPDFVFWPDDGVDDLPIAAFLDGWQYHKDSVLTDLSKRMAIAKSGKFSVWTLTWEDLDGVLQARTPTTTSPWPTLLEGGGANVAQTLCDAHGIGGINGLKALPPFLQLHQRLGNWRHEDLRKLSMALAVGMVMPPGSAVLLQAIVTGEFWTRLQELSLLPDQSALRLGVRRLGAALTLVAGIQAEQLRRLMSGDADAQNEPVVIGEWSQDNADENDRKGQWQLLWQCLNLLLHLRHAWVGAADLPALDALSRAPILRTRPSGMSDAWQQALELIIADARIWAQALADQGIAAPEVGFELLDDRGRVIGEAEMAWPSKRIALLMANDGAAPFTAAMWTCFVVDQNALPEELMQGLRETTA